MTFTDAVVELRRGNRVSRRRWKYNGVYLYASPSDDNIYKYTPVNVIINWVPSYGDLISEDWIVI